jgi:hypothetical protein
MIKAINNVDNIVNLGSGGFGIAIFWRIGSF